MCSILLVDNESQFLELLEEYLTLLGYSITACQSGQEGLNAVNNYTYDLIICDLHVPGTDGLTIIQQHKNQNPKGVSILYSGIWDRSASEDPSVDIFLLEPFDFSYLHDLIMELLK